MPECGQIVQEMLIILEDNSSQPLNEAMTFVSDPQTGIASLTLATDLNMDVNQISSIYMLKLKA